MFPENKIRGLKNIVKYLNSSSIINEPIVTNNMYMHIQNIPYISIKDMILPKILSDGVLYNASSPSFLEYNGKLVMNIRYVNYILNDLLQYEYKEPDVLTKNMRYINNIVINPPTETDCEKNWIPIPNGIKDNLAFIYKWHPLEIGVLSSGDKTAKLNIIQSVNTPPIFKLMRGSSSLVAHGDEYWCITHGVRQRQNNTRQYFHFIVILDIASFEIKKYSVPFCFDTFDIEYCVGMTIRNDIMHIAFSKRDRNPHLLSVDLKDIRKLFI